MNVTAEVIKNFDEEAAFNIISNTFNSHDHSTLNAISHQCSFNPIDKIVEVFEENKKLYERLLQSEKEKVEVLERMLKEK